MVCAGLTNTVTAVKNAQMAESPILLIGGAAASLLKGRGALQDIDQMCLFRPLCKFCATINHLRDIKPVLTKALHIAQSDTPGVFNFIIALGNVLFVLMDSRHYSAVDGTFEVFNG